NAFKYNNTFLYQLSTFHRRLSEVAKRPSQSDRSSRASWFWSKIDSGISKLIHGDVDDEPEEEVQPKVTQVKQQPKKVDLQPKEETIGESSSKSSSPGWFSWVPSFGIKRKTPNLGKTLSGSYTYDEKHGVWLKPGQKPEDVIQKAAPPPTMSNAQQFTPMMSATPIGMRAKYVAFGGFGSSEPQTTNSSPVMQPTLQEPPRMQPPKKFFVPASP